MNSLDIEQTGELEFDVVFSGKQTPLRIVIFMDDNQAPDLAFFTSPELAERINIEFVKYFDELGM